MRNQSGEILRLVAGGQTIRVTNRGEVAAVIVPPGGDTFTDLVLRGEVGVARRSPSSLRSVMRGESHRDTEAIVADVRGRW